jgi:hypothetical protein
MSERNELRFDIQAIISQTEIWTIVNGKEYIYWIDGALIPEFRKLYSRTPGKALNFLKTHSYKVERRNTDELEKTIQDEIRKLGVNNSYY